MKKINYFSFIIAFMIMLIGNITYAQALPEDDSENYIATTPRGEYARQQEQAAQIKENLGDINSQMLDEAIENEDKNPQDIKKTTTSSNNGTEKCSNGCCGIKLNTNFPIIGNCIETKSDEANPTNAFPYMVGALTKFIISLIMVVCFILVIVAGIMRAGDKPKEGKELLKKVAITILLLGFSGVILRLINPNFFG